jgi:dihydrolipoamide dehydrogenase
MTRGERVRCHRHRRRDRRLLGGTCLNWGCIPTKALLEHAHALKIAQAAKEWGLILGDQPARIDMNQVQARKDKIVTVLTRGIEFLFKKNDITWIKGSARLAAPGAVEVTGDQGQVLTAPQIVIATGSNARSARCRRPS